MRIYAKALYWTKFKFQEYMFCLKCYTEKLGQTSKVWISRLKLTHGMKRFVTRNAHVKQESPIIFPLKTFVKDYNFCDRDGWTDQWNEGQIRFNVPRLCQNGGQKIFLLLNNDLSQTAGYVTYPNAFFFYEIF